MRHAERMKKSARHRHKRKGILQERRFTEEAGDHSHWIRLQVENLLRSSPSQISSAGPKHGCLSFPLAAAQLLVKMTSALQKSECCSATSAVQLSENCNATSVFACGMLQGWGLEGWGLGLADLSACGSHLRLPPPPAASKQPTQGQKRLMLGQGCLRALFGELCICT